MRISSATWMLSLAAVLASSGALAAQLRLKGSAGAEPRFADKGLSLAVSGELSGLGEGDLNVVVTASGEPTATCTDVSGLYRPTERSLPTLTRSGSRAISASRVRDGSISFSVITAAPESPVPGAPNCPDPTWTETIADLAFTEATITVEQGGAVLEFKCNFDAPTSDGALNPGDVTCIRIS